MYLCYAEEPSATEVYSYHSRVILVLFTAARFYYVFHSFQVQKSSLLQYMHFFAQAQLEQTIRLVTVRILTGCVCSAQASRACSTPRAGPSGTPGTPSRVRAQHLMRYLLQHMRRTTDTAQQRAPPSEIQLLASPGPGNAQNALFARQRVN